MNMNVISLWIVLLVWFANGWIARGIWDRQGWRIVALWAMATRRRSAYYATPGGENTVWIKASSEEALIEAGSRYSEAGYQRVTAMDLYRLRWQRRTVTP